VIGLEEVVEGGDFFAKKEFVEQPEFSRGENVGAEI
jgi:hypothetical protein